MTIKRGDRRLAFQDGGQLLFASFALWVYGLARCSLVKQNQDAANKRGTENRIKKVFLILNYFSFFYSCQLLMRKNVENI